MTSPAAPSSDSKIFSILGKNLKANTASDLEPYLSELIANEHVEEVHFGGNSLGVEACEAIAEALKGKKSLKVADFADCFTGRLISEIPLALSAICTALQSHTSLIELDLSDNAFGGRCADAMVPFLTNNRHFQVFKLNNNGLGIFGGRIVSGAILENAERAKAEGGEIPLRVIVCGRNRLENGSATHWGKAFSACPNLEQVRLPQNGIRMEGIQALASSLRACTKLRVLDLQDNTCTESGTRAISASLPSWPDLTTLNLSDCLLSPKGGISLATALEKGTNPNLSQLKLQYGEFDARAIHILAKAIQAHLKDLTVLELNGNRADPEDECIERVKDALASHGHEDALDELDDMEEPEEDESDNSGPENGDVNSDNDDGAEDDEDEEAGAVDAAKEVADEAKTTAGGIVAAATGLMDSAIDSLSSALESVGLKTAPGTTTSEPTKLDASVESTAGNPGLQQA